MKACCCCIVRALAAPHASISGPVCFYAISLAGGGRLFLVGDVHGDGASGPPVGLPAAAFFNRVATTATAESPAAVFFESELPRDAPNARHRTNAPLHWAGGENPVAESVESVLRPHIIGAAKKEGLAVHAVDIRVRDGAACGSLHFVEALRRTRSRRPLNRAFIEAWLESSVFEPLRVARHGALSEQEADAALPPGLSAPGGGPLLHRWSRAAVAAAFSLTSPSFDARARAYVSEYAAAVRSETSAEAAAGALDMLPVDLYTIALAERELTSGRAVWLFAGAAHVENVARWFATPAFSPAAAAEVTIFPTRGGFSGSALLSHHALFAPPGIADPPRKEVKLLKFCRHGALCKTTRMTARSPPSPGIPLSAGGEPPSKRRRFVPTFFVGFTRRSIGDDGDEDVDKTTKHYPRRRFDNLRKLAEFIFTTLTAEEPFTAPAVTASPESLADFSEAVMAALATASFQPAEDDDATGAPTLATSVGEGGMKVFTAASPENPKTEDPFDCKIFNRWKVTLSLDPEDVGHAEMKALFVTDNSVFTVYHFIIDLKA